MATVAKHQSEIVIYFDNLDKKQTQFANRNVTQKLCRTKNLPFSNYTKFRKGCY